MASVVSSLSFSQLKEFDMISSCKIQIDMDSSPWKKKLVYKILEIGKKL